MGTVSGEWVQVVGEEDMFDYVVDGAIFGYVFFSHYLVR